MSEQASPFIGRVREYVRNAPVIGAVLVGGVSYLLGFSLTYLFVIIDSGLNAQSSTETAVAKTGVFQQSGLIGFPQPEPTTMEFVGWIFYNQHFADTVITPQVISRASRGSTETQAVPESINILSTASTQIPSVVYQLIPVVLLTASGYALARTAQIGVSRDIIRVGLAIPTGYVPFALIGTFLFRTSTTAEQDGIDIMVTASPSLVGPVTMALISTVFGVVGLYLGAQSGEADNETQ